MRKKIIIPAAALAMVGGMFYASQGVSAQVATSEAGEPHQFAQRIAERFGLNAEEVHAVMQELRQEKRQQKQERMQERLDELVAAGELTAEQRDALQQKHAELAQERLANTEEWQSLSRDERRELKQSRRQEMREWAETQGIDLSVLRPDRDGMGKRGNN